MRTQEHIIWRIIRRLLRNGTWKETDDSGGSTTLTYKSLVCPERHVWIDTWIDVYGSIIIDLEDWNDETQWDSSVAHFAALDCETIAKIARAWLQGDPLDIIQEIFTTQKSTDYDRSESLIK